MMYLIWLLLCGGYGILLWTAEKRKRSAEAVLCFWDGCYLALICFGILPCAMAMEAFYPAAAASVLGACGSFGLEQNGRWQPFLRVMFFGGLTAVQFLHTGDMEGCEAILLAFWGGMGLYHACAGILPEGIPPREHIVEALLSAAGFLLGTGYFSGLW